MWKPLKNILKGKHRYVKTILILCPCSLEKVCKRAAREDKAKKEELVKQHYHSTQHLNFSPGRDAESAGVVEGREKGDPIWGMARK